MVFLRKKQIRGRGYYYIVKSRVINGKIRQKVLMYLGNPENILKVFDFYKKHHK